MGFAAAVPAIATGISAGGQLLGGKMARKAQSKKEAAAQKILDAYAGKTGSFQDMLARAFGVDPTTGAMSGLAASLAQPQKTTTESEQTINQLTMPEIAKELAGGESTVYKRLLGEVERGSALPPGYATRQAAKIQAAAEPGRTAERNIAVRHGVSPDVLAVSSPSGRTATSQILDLEANLPMMEREMGQENLDRLSGYLTGRRGSRTRGRTSGTSTTTGGADVNSILGIYNLLKPEKPDVFV